MNQHDILPDLSQRRDLIREWIARDAREALSEQDHLVEGSPERAYWHHGYQAALDDIIRRLHLTIRGNCSVGISNP
jgi:hypothetical protein